MQHNPLIKYFLKLTFLSIAVCFLGFIAIMVFSPKYVSLQMPYYILMFWLATFASYAINYLSMQKGYNKLAGFKFEHIFLLTKFGKLFIYLIVFVILLLTNKAKALPNTITFLSLYVVYLVFDTLMLNALIKENRINNNK
jgi:hypothetical protein